MVDDEGVLKTVDVSAKFVNGSLEAIEARYFMKTLGEWDRFMRFMERYASENGLGFQKVSSKSQNSLHPTNRDRIKPISRTLSQD